MFAKMARPTKNPPHGMEDYDLGALSDEQQAALTSFKIKTRMHNEDYLRTHPQVEVLISGFLRELLLRRPNNVREFAAAYFTHPDLTGAVKQKVLEKQKS
ncbi:RIIa domain-containing protein 1-like [Clavelina lepadiformis]|uniref:RIIa domain-containing protein 1 n=1 Tax=Clavelina lepadiformis TaxID=159417 RepID=A0ABP0GSU8_CLALP